VGYVRSHSRRRLRLALTGAALAALALAGLVLGGGVAVALTDAGPEPSTVTAALGDTVTFANQGAVPYTVEATGKGLTSPTLAPGESFAYVLTHSGRISYRQRGPKEGFRGEIVVQRVGQVTLGLRGQQSPIRFGARVTLDGLTSLPSFPVVIQSKQAGEREWSDLVARKPAPDGRFSANVLPLRNVEYRASVLSEELLSEPVSVDVKPIATLRAAKSAVPTGKRITLIVRVRPAQAAKSVSLMRYDRDRARWRREARRPLTGGKAVFLWPAEQGRTILRAWLKRSDLKPGFAESYSSQIRVTGSGKAPEKQR
jgi:plastocyanin